MTDIDPYALTDEQAEGITSARSEIVFTGQVEACRMGQGGALAIGSFLFI